MERTDKDAKGLQDKCISKYGRNLINFEAHVAI